MSADCFPGKTVKKLNSENCVVRVNFTKYIT